MFKNLFIILLPLLVFANEKLVINYWSPFSGGDSRPMQFIVDQYNKTQDAVIVNFKVLPWAEYYTKIKETTDNEIDIAIIHGSKLEELIQLKKLLPLKQLAKESNVNWDEFTDDTKSLIEFNNDFYAIPIDTHLMLTYYNKSILQKLNGINLDDPFSNVKNQQDFIEFFTNLKENTPKDIKTLGQPIDNIFPFWIWYSLYNQMDNKGYIDDKKVLFNNEQALKALEVLTTLRDKGIYSELITDNQAYNMFKFNKSAIFFSGVWATWNFEQNKKLEFGVSPFPKVFEKFAVWGDSHTLAIPSNVIDKTKQIEILKFANFVSDQGIEWSIAGHIPSKKKLLNDKQYKQSKIRYQYSQYLPYVVRMPKHPKVWECNDKLTEIFSDMMMSQKSAKETLALAVQEIKKIINNE